MLSPRERSPPPATRLATAVVAGTNTAAIDPRHRTTTVTGHHAARIDADPPVAQTTLIDAMSDPERNPDSTPRLNPYPAVADATWAFHGAQLANADGSPVPQRDSAVLYATTMVIACSFTFTEAGVFDDGRWRAIYERVKKGLADLRRAARMQTDQPAPRIPTDYAVLIYHDLRLALLTEPADLYLRATESSPGPKSLKDAGYTMPTQAALALCPLPCEDPDLPRLGPRGPEATDAMDHFYKVRVCGSEADLILERSLPLRGPASLLHAPEVLQSIAQTETRFHAQHAGAGAATPPYKHYRFVNDFDWSNIPPNQQGVVEMSPEVFNRLNTDLERFYPRYFYCRTMHRPQRKPLPIVQFAADDSNSMLYHVQLRNWTRLIDSIRIYAPNPADTAASLLYPCKLTPRPRSSHAPSLLVLWLSSEQQTRRSGSGRLSPSTSGRRAATATSRTCAISCTGSSKLLRCIARRARH